MSESVQKNGDAGGLLPGEGRVPGSDARWPAAARTLLAKYRHLSLARAPVRERVAVLREIAAADPATPAWRSDLEELEKTRLFEMRHEAVDCIRDSDADRIDALLDELDAGKWQAPVPTELREMLSRASIALHRHGAVDALRALVPEVRAALQSLSPDEARDVFARWGRVVKKSQVRVPPELLEEIAPLSRWLDEQEDRRERDRAFDGACAALASALASGADVEELKPLHRQLLGFENEMPEDLSVAYRRRIEALTLEARTERRRQYALAAGLVLAVAAALVALAWAIIAGMRR